MELALLRDGAAPELAGRLDRSLALMDAGIRSIRRVTDDLRPTLLDDLGLLPALRSLATEFAERSGTPVELVAPRALPPLAKEAELAVFRALQEALANVARHSGSREASVRLRSRGQSLELDIEDHGRGFAPDGSRRGLGLVAMRERAALVGGTLDVSEVPGGGTRVRLTVPTVTSSAVA